MAKRVNKRILIVLTGLVLGGGVMAMAACTSCPGC
jgi:hypothetical protein